MVQEVRAKSSKGAEFLALATKSPPGSCTFHAKDSVRWPSEAVEQRLIGPTASEGHRTLSCQIRLALGRIVRVVRRGPGCSLFYRQSHEYHQCSRAMAMGNHRLGAAGDHCAILPQAETTAAGGSKHISMEPDDRGSARQLDLAATTSEPVVVSAASVAASANTRMLPTRMARSEVDGRSLHLSD